MERLLVALGQGGGAPSRQADCLTSGNSKPSALSRIRIRGRIRPPFRRALPGPRGGLSARRFTISRHPPSPCAGTRSCFPGGHGQGCLSGSGSHPTQSLCHSTAQAEKRCAIACLIMSPFSGGHATSRHDPAPHLNLAATAHRIARREAQWPPSRPAQPDRTRIVPTASTMTASQVGLLGPLADVVEESVDLGRRLSPGRSCRSSRRTGRTAGVRARRCDVVGTRLLHHDL